MPSRNIAVDESTVPFKGKAVIKMYNSQKPNKWGFKICVLPDRKTQPYYVKETTDQLAWQDLPFTARIVLHLVNKVIFSANTTGCHAYTDRFYISVQLAQELQKLKVHITGSHAKPVKHARTTKKEKCQNQYAAVTYKRNDITYSAGLER